MRARAKPLKLGAIRGDALLRSSIVGRHERVNANNVRLDAIRVELSTTIVDMWTTLGALDNRVVDAGTGQGALDSGLPGRL